MPFTLFGALTGIAIVLLLTAFETPRSVSEGLFWAFHPVHVLLSALTTAAMYRLHGRGGLLSTIAVGYIGSVAIATLSDCVIPYVGEALLDLPNRGIHLGFIEKWWLIHPLAFLGIAAAFVWQSTKFPHAGHVLLSTWASLFHIAMALPQSLDLVTLTGIATLLFLSVWIPCCTSDIVFPLLFASAKTGGLRDGGT